MYDLFKTCVSGENILTGLRATSRTVNASRSAARLEPIIKQLITHIAQMHQSQTNALPDRGPLRETINAQLPIEDFARTAHGFIDIASEIKSYRKFDAIRYELLAEINDILNLITDLTPSDQAHLVSAVSDGIEELTTSLRCSFSARSSMTNLSRSLALLNVMNVTSAIGRVTASSEGTPMAAIRYTQYTMMFALLSYNAYLATDMFRHRDAVKRTVAFIADQASSARIVLSRPQPQDVQDWRTAENLTQRQWLFDLLNGVIHQAVADSKTPLRQPINQFAEQALKELIKVTLVLLMTSMLGLSLNNAKELSFNQTFINLALSIVFAYTIPIVVDSQVFSRKVSEPFTTMCTASAGRACAEPLQQAVSTGLSHSLQSGIFTTDEAENVKASENSLGSLIRRRGGAALAAATTAATSAEMNSDDNGYYGFFRRTLSSAASSAVNSPELQRAVANI